MFASVEWINAYLDRPAPAEEQAELLTRAGFPLEGREDAGEGDARQDFEMTSNRGDCVCHLGLAREVAAISGRTLKPPVAQPRAAGPAAAGLVKLTNREPKLCPLYTARIIRGVKVGPSPRWLARRLESIGQIPRNNIVDATNFVLFELGQPAHVFDLAKLRGPEIIVRHAKDKEPFLPIGEGALEIKLDARDLVIADVERAVAIAGIKGGALTAVTGDTRDILIEAATFDHVAVRGASRRHGIFSDSSFRFERGVHPGQVDPAAERLAALILELAGGELCSGAVAAGGPIPPRRAVTMRPERCRQILGMDISTDRMIDALARLGYEPRNDGERLHCTVPVHRLDIEREIDLIEEVARMHGLDQIPIADTISIRAAPPQPRELARQAVTSTLVGAGHVETVTHSLVSEAAARAFLDPGCDLLMVADERAKAEPALRPSSLPSLLRVRKLNQDGGVHDLRLFESAAVFHRVGDSPREEVRLALLADAPDDGAGLRSLRGVIERLVILLLGPAAKLDVQPDSSAAWFSVGAKASVNGQALGRLGVLAPQTARTFGLDRPLLAADLSLPALYDRFPPETEARALPAFPAIERDLSAIIDERVAWEQVRGTIDSLRLPLLESVEFVTTYRGKQVGLGRKSLTLRLRFRAPDRTLTSDQADDAASKAVDALRSQLSAEIRA